MGHNRILPVLLVLVSCPGVLSGQSTPSLPSEDTSAMVVDWIQRTAVPLRYVEAGHGDADLEPLRTVLKDVRIVGLGEATHGSSENFQVKHRLLEFLVTRMGFTAFAMEAAYSDAQPINDYVMYGRGDRASVLTGQGYVAWDTEEFARMLDWLRAYNRTVPDARKVRFYGFDMHRNAVGRREVLAYLRTVAPERVASTDSIFRILAGQEAKWPQWDTVVVASARPGFQGLVDYLTANEGALVRRSSAAQYGRMLRFAEVMRLSVLPKPRSHMPENLMYIIDHERPGTKFVLWAAEYHLSKGQAPRNVGWTLRERYGDQYYSVGFDYGQGSYQARVLPPGGPPGELKAVVVPPAARGSLAWHMSRAGIGNFFLDLRPEPTDPAVRAWLDAPQVMRDGSWAYAETPHTQKRSPTELYDGIIYLDSTTAARPTPNALRIVSQKAGF